MTVTPSAPRAGTRRRAVFLDVDGTYAHLGDVPEAHAQAVRAARAAGHLVLLCTGRPLSMLPERIVGAGFDGVVASAGGYVAVGDRVLSDLRFPADLAARTVALLDAHDVAYVLEAPEILHGPPGVDVRLRELLVEHARRHGYDEPDHEGPSDILDVLVMSADLRAASFAKVTCFDSPVPMPRIAEDLGPQVAVLPSSIPGMGRSAGELYLADVHKARGMALAAEALGVDRADVVAVGDGLNDLEMLAWAGTGVAVEGSDRRVLAAADRTTPPPERDGVAVLLGELGLV